ncbi:hypothetical protein RUM43_004063 [Polyplax serrata]|uniref:Alpha-galactosidase n=1 Tax=Polyplax serrata TaxID=468196 RepID=A0AAN8SAH8_POLSC
MSLALENGLARTPPMGWLTWERFECTTDCTTYPDDCISEKLMKDMADRMVSDGYLAAGYEYLIVDDCWLAKTRDSNGNLQPDKDRFPSGMKALGDYIHSKGLKFGIYEDYGTQTCAGLPGILGHMKQDADLFASWGVDYVKLDGCHADAYDMDEGYIEFGKHLLETKRPMVYSCSWPTYQDASGISPNFSRIAEHCNLWRNYDDIYDRWSSVSNIIDYFASQQANIAHHAGPGHWNDPDMLIIGNYGLTYEQAKSQMAIWAILAAPLIMSNDLRDIKPEFRDILLNKDVIAINQHPLGIQGQRKYKTKGIEFWTKPLDPYTGEKGKTVFAVAALSQKKSGIANQVSIPLVRLGIDPHSAYTFIEVFKKMEPFVVPINGSLTVKVAPTGVLLFNVRTS